MKTNYPLGTIGFCTACGNYCVLKSNVEQGEYWAWVDSSDLSDAEKNSAPEIFCGCNA